VTRYRRFDRCQNDKVKGLAIGSKRKGTHFCVSKTSHHRNFIPIRNDKKALPIAAIRRMEAGAAGHKQRGGLGSMEALDEVAENTVETELGERALLCFKRFARNPAALKVPEYRVPQTKGKAAILFDFIIKRNKTLVLNSRF